MMLLELDDRRRASLGKLGHHNRYFAEELPDGTLVLHPAAVVPDAQARLFLGNRELYDQIEAASAATEEAFVKRSYKKRGAAPDA